MQITRGVTFLFSFKISAAESLCLLSETYGKHTPSILTYEYCFRRFKQGDCVIEDKKYPGHQKKFE